MAKKGIAQITGSKVLKLGEVGHYHISKTYRPEDKANISHAKWKLYVKENNNWRELKPVAGTPPKIGSETTITITNQKLLGKELLLEAYLYEPEKSSPPGIVIKIEEGKKKIERVDLFRTDDSSISNSDVLKYGQSIIVKVITVNMPNEKVEITLYEDDENGVGHNANNEKNKVDSVEKRLDHDGFAMHTFKLPIDFQRIANAYMDGSQDKFHEYYINVKSATDSKASSNVNLPNPDYTYPEQEIEEVVISVKAKEIGVDPLPETGRSVNVVKEVKIEGLLDAYFAKKEYTKQTGEEAGTVEYTFGGNGNKTSTDAEKEKIAKIIVGKSQITSLKNKKEYTTVEAIKAALTADVYNKDQKITIKTFKLGEEFKRVNSAPLEDKLYLVATTSMLDGKEATIIIKEKDGIIKGSAGAVLPVLEITEEQMEQKTNTRELQGTEKTEFKGTVKDGMVKIPIHLRPKSDDELKQWKDKLTKGKEDGNYTYTFKNQTALPNGSGDEKKRIAQAILGNAIGGKMNNPKIETGKTAFADDIEKALVKEVYLAGQTITFPLYKKETELLYLQAKAQGEKQHDKEFLKQDGAYFQIGKKCECEARIRAFMRTIRVAEGTGEYRKGTKEARNPQLGYTTWFSGGGNNFSDLSTHPQTINCNSTKTLCSSAAGAYQIMGWKFDELNGYLIQEHNDTYKTVKPLVYNEDTDLAKKYDAKGFNEISQDRLCLIILTKKNIIPSILKGNIEEAINKAKGIWVSLPGATAGQPTAKMQETLDYYQEFLQKELTGLSNLHVKSGFLKDFGYECQCNEESTNTNSSWRDPIDNPEITLYNYYGNYNPAGSSFGKVRNNGTKNHQGLDIFAPTGTPVKACLDGTVVTVNQNDGNWGKLIVIEIKKEDLDNSRRNYTLQYNGEIEKGANYGASNKRFLRYAHLSETQVTEGQLVKAGDTIGLSGSTGNAVNQHIRARHLHFDIANVKNAGTGTGERENPAFYVRLVPPNNERQKNNTK